MKDLESNPIEGVWYRAFLLEDGQSFMHINICDSDEILNKINDVEMFNKFRKELMVSEPITPPKSEDIIMIQ